MEELAGAIGRLNSVAANPSKKRSRIPPQKSLVPFGPSRGSRSGETLKNPLKTQKNEWCRRRESNDTRLLILRNLLQTYERKNRTTRCMPASYVQNHVQQFEGRVRRGPLNAGLRSSPSRIQDSIRELPDGNVSAGRRDAGGSRGIPR